MIQSARLYNDRSWPLAVGGRRFNHQSTTTNQQQALANQQSASAIKGLP
jgi:hypothetical protein